MPLAQRPPQVMLSDQDSEMSSPNMHSNLGTACTVMVPSRSSTDGSQLSNCPLSGKQAMPRDPNPKPAAKRVRLGVDQATSIQIDNPNQKLEEDPLKARAGTDLPTIRQVKLQLAPEEYTPGACSLLQLPSASMLSGVKPPYLVWTWEFRPQ